MFIIYRPCCLSVNVIQYSTRKIIKVHPLSSFLYQKIHISLILGIAVKNRSKLADMPFMKKSRYSTCKGEDLYCSTKIVNRMSTYKQELLYYLFPT